MGSMHGTFVNDKRIASDQNHTIQNGDVVTFGAAVTRGDGTFDTAVTACNSSFSLFMLIKHDSPRHLQALESPLRV